MSTPEQIIGILREAELLQNQGEKIEVSGAALKNHI